MKILFFLDRGLDITYLEPIYEYLKAKEPGWDLFFFTHDPASRKIITDKGYPLKRGNYDYAFVCDGMSVCYPSRGKKISTFHGLASKGRELSLKRAQVYQEFNGYFMAPSGYYRDILIDRLGVDESKVIVTGLSKFDALPPEPKGSRILFAPTYNEELSAAAVISKELYKLRDISVHLHYCTRTSSDNDTDETFRQKFARKNNNQENISELIAASQIVIADFGSVILEAMAMGKMAIQVVNPDYEKFYLEREGLTKKEMNELPEVELPKKYGLQAKNLKEVKAHIANYPDYPKMPFPIVENIGHASEVIHAFIASN